MSDYVPAVLLGTAIGDAMGMPFESYGCEIHPKLVHWKGGFEPGNYHRLEAGRWTDDTEMSLELAKSMLVEKRYSGRLAASHYVAWIKGNPTGTGSTTRDALRGIDTYGLEAWNACGIQFKDPEAVGSGTAMRAASIGVMYADMPEMLRRICRADAYITHAHEEAYAASLAVAATVAGIVRYRTYNPTDPHFHWQGIYNFVDKQMLVVSNTLTARALRKGHEILQHGGMPEEFADTIAGRFGSAWQCSTTAIACAFRGWQSFEGGIRLAVELGGDTDTRGAITGAILGAKFGLRGISLPLKNHVYKGAELEEMDQELFAARARRHGQDTKSSLL